MAFRTTSDTEVLLALYARDGERMLPRLRGMFAFAIWDASSREVFLARDPYGIKPLYYSQTERGVVFASQVKAILASGMVAARHEMARSVEDVLARRTRALFLNARAAMEMAPAVAGSTWAGGRPADTLVNDLLAPYSAGAAQPNTAEPSPQSPIFLWMGQ